MTGISPPTESKYAVHEREYEVDEPEPVFYVEKDTNFIYEVKFFPEFALIRLVMPDHQPPVARISIPAFAEQFDEFCGDVKELRNFLFGSTLSHIQVDKK